MNSRLVSHLPDDEVLWLLEEEGLLPLRPLRERWYLGAPLPATFELEEVPAHTELPHPGHAAPATVDWLAERRKKAAVPAGRYPIEIQPDRIDTYTTPRTSGVAFTVTITEGPWQGGEIHLHFVLDGPLDGVVRHNLDLLARWAHAVGAGPAADPIDLVARLGRAGSGRRVVLDIRERQNGDRRDVFVADVEVS